MKRLLLIALTAGLVTQPVDLSAQFAPVPGATEYLNFVGAGPALTATWGGVKVGPYVAQFQTPGQPTSPQFSIYCVDYDHTARDQWINATSLTTPLADPTLGPTRLDNYAKYQKLAYLSSLFDSWGDLGTNQQVVWSAIHSAIWKVASDESLGSGHAATWALRNDLLWGDDHKAAAGSFDTNGWYVLSPAPYYNGQEFLIRTPRVSVPEPATFLLLATGLVLLAGASRRRLRGLA